MHYTYSCTCYQRYADMIVAFRCKYRSVETEVFSPISVDNDKIISNYLCHYIVETSPKAQVLFSLPSQYN